MASRRFRRSRRNNTPHWVTVKYACECGRCGVRIPKGARGFYYPATRTMLCSAEGCGGQGARDLAREVSVERYGHDLAYVR